MSGIRFRPFRNSDPPHLVRLWNLTLPALGVARPLGIHEFDTIVTGTAVFDREGLIVAEDEGGAILGYAHAGFGPPLPEGPGLVLSREMGTIAMLALDVKDIDAGPPPWARDLIFAAERYLRRKGTSVFYAGGLYPLNPFYWGLYGGSEYAGVLSGHATFHQAVRACGYLPVATTVMLEADLAEGNESRDPKQVLLKRKVRLEITEDATLSHWWDNLSLAHHRVAAVQLVSKADASTMAQAALWDMEGFSRIDGKSRYGMLGLYVAPDHRRQGYGRFLVSEIMKHARLQLIDRLVVQTGATNAPARALYESLGFRRIEQSTTYRLPGELSARSREPLPGEEA